MSSGSAGLTRKLDGAPPVLPPISPLIDRRKLHPSAFEPVAESLEKGGFSVGWNEGSLQVGGSLAQSGICSPTSGSSRSSYRPRTSGFLSFSRARESYSRQRTPGSSSIASAPLPESPLTPPLVRRHPTPHERFSRLGASLDSATANSFFQSTDASPEHRASYGNHDLPAQSSNAAAGVSEAYTAAAAAAIAAHAQPPPQPPQSPCRSVASAPLPSPSKVATTMGLSIPLENLKDSQRPGTSVGGSMRYTGNIIQVPLGVPSPRSHQSQVAAFKATRGHALMVFNELDSDKNGKITRSEFEAAALSLGFSLEQAQRFWEKLDSRHRSFLEAADWGTKDAFKQIQLFSTRYLQKYMGVPDVSSTPEQVRKYNRAQEILQVKSLAAAINMVRSNAVSRGLRCAGATGNPIYDTFRFMDVDGSGALSKDELRDAFFALGVYLSEPVVQQIMQAFDKNGNGLVQYHEFERTMFPPARGN